MRRASFSLPCMRNFGIQHTFKVSTDGKQDSRLQWGEVEGGNTR